MDFGEQDVKKLSIFALIGVIAVLTFILVKPILFSIIGGLVLAYVFNPVYKWMLKYVRNESLTAIILIFLILLILILPIWFIVPIVIQQVFELFRIAQALDVPKFVATMFPTASEQLVTQLSLTISTLISKLTTGIVGSLINIFTELPAIIIGLFLSGFVFFYALRDSNELYKFISGISPINKDKEKILSEQFKGITNSILYGHFIVGFIQGILTGIGLLIFGVNNALVLTILAVFVSFIPFLGPYLIWIPVTIILFATGSSPLIAITYLVYNITIVSTLDNVVRSYLVSKRTNISPALIMIGIIGGLLVFGVMGILIGPLIIAYLIVLLRSYKDKNLYSLFS